MIAWLEWRVVVAVLLYAWISVVVGIGQRVMAWWRP